MADTRKTPGAEQEEPVLDRTPVSLEAQGNIRIQAILNAGIDISPAQVEEFDNHEGGTRVVRGQDITVDKYVADNLTKMMIKSTNPKHLKRDVPAFVPSTNI